ncbi:NmrA domain-containing protein [Mycena indigotica]|uniref:NmrA domain-containing protein n=1 Tax=Mycena indigotica TaxID=2126181 RepID=A0A8H6SGT6_9AGAR|nr:NmrA domain-containing protein [Mycena indigotica]KAF7298627.1 NmrA domain-containing protein [Mycena indigotica]
MQPTLPPELWDAILDLLVDNDDLRRCGLVCRAWLPATRHRLYEAPLSVCDDNDLERFLEYLQSPHNTLRVHLSGLNITYTVRYRKKLQEILAALPGLAGLTELRLNLPYNHCSYTDFPRLQQVTRLGLHAMSFPRFLHFTLLLQKMRSIKHLVLGRIEWTGVAKETGQFCLLHGTCIALESLEFNLAGDAHAPEDEPFLDWLAWDKSAPIVKEVTIHLCEEVAPKRADQVAQFIGHNAAILASLHIKFASHKASPCPCFNPDKRDHHDLDMREYLAMMASHFQHTLPTLLECLPRGNTLTKLILLMPYLYLEERDIPVLPDYTRLKAVLHGPTLASLVIIQFYALCKGHAIDKDGALAPKHHPVQSIVLEQLSWGVVNLVLGKEEDARRAFDGADYAFLVTNFSEHMSMERELAEGKLLIDAAKSVSTMRGIIWSGLLSPGAASNGKYTRMVHFEGKAAVSAYGLSTTETLPVGFAIVPAAFYMQQMAKTSGPIRMIEQNPDNPDELIIRWNVRKTTKLPFIDVERDYGQFVVKQVIEADVFPNGREVNTASEALTPEEIADAVAEVTGKKVTYKQISTEDVEQRLNDAGVPQHFASSLAESLAFADEFGFYAGGSPVDSEGLRLHTFKEFAQDVGLRALLA